MREVFQHWPGRLLLAFLALCTTALLGAAWTFERGIVVLGWMPLPFALGIAFTALALVASGVYLFRYWPYR